MKCQHHHESGEVEEGWANMEKEKLGRMSKTGGEKGRKETGKGKRKRNMFLKRRGKARPSIPWTCITTTQALRHFIPSPPRPHTWGRGSTV